MIGGARGVGVAGVGWAYVCSVVSPKLPSRGLEAAGVQVTLWPLATCFSPLCGVRVPTLHVAVCPGHQCVVLVQGQEAVARRAWGVGHFTRAPLLVFPSPCDRVRGSRWCVLYCVVLCTASRGPVKVGSVAVGDACALVKVAISAITPHNVIWCLLLHRDDRVAVKAVARLRAAETHP